MNNQKRTCTYANCVCKVVDLRGFRKTPDWKNRKWHKICYVDYKKNIDDIERQKSITFGDIKLLQHLEDQQRKLISTVEG